MFERYESIKKREKTSREAIAVCARAQKNTQCGMQLNTSIIAQPGYCVRYIWQRGKVQIMNNFRDKMKNVIFNPKYYREQWWILNWGERQWDFHFVRIDWNQYTPNKLEKSTRWVRRKLCDYYKNLKVGMRAWSGSSEDEEGMGFKYNLGGKINRTGRFFSPWLCWVFTVV